MATIKEQNEKASNQSSQSEETKNLKGFYASLQEHLTADYRKKYNVRRFFSCLFLYLFLNFYFAIQPEHSIVSIILPIIWTVLAWIFWKYAFWSYQGGIIDRFTNSLILFGSIGALIGKIILANFLILIWIALIAPFSGLKTWRKAVKNNKNLFINNDRSDVWD
ncbi:hypothetical protein ACFO26_04840 [Lactococcus nasutitermitis]|uniref:Uncharacterized protein n=1 Tax=Lactococcus nasutitermitis TaxID=1652957 RepID=A0ABV9JBQ7_9LACT|nr:hypothetical protein [Lactococcus nasutitermitis]